MTEQQKKVFPIELIRFRPGTLVKFPHSWCLTLPLAPFDLPHGFPKDDEYAEDYDNIKTEFSIDFVGIDPNLLPPAKHTYKEYDNSVIDASVYILDTHHLIDLLTLDTSTAGVFRFDGILRFEYQGLEYNSENGYQDSPISFEVILEETENCIKAHARLI